ncbi:TPA: IS66 family transposase [Enterobacter asburiae]
MIDVLGPEKRRRRSVQEKIAIVQQSFEPGMTVSLVARQHGVAASQLFLWRKQYQEGSLTAVAAGEQVVPASELASAMKQIKELQRLLGKKTMENELLKEAVEYGRPKKVDSARALVAGGWRISLVSRCLRVSRAQLHAMARRSKDWQDRRCKRKPDDTDALARIHTVIGDLPTYGYRRVVDHFLPVVDTDRKGIHPQTHLAGFSGVLQADAYAGFNELYRNGRITEAACWAHARRKIHDVHIRTPSALTEEALRQIGQLYAIEADIRGMPSEQRLAERQRKTKPLLKSLESWLREKMKTLSRHSELTKAFAYALNQWPALTYYADDGWAEADNNIAENALRTVSLGRKNFLFFGSDHGGERGALLYSLIGTCKLNGVEPESYLRYVLDVIADWPINRVSELLPWRVALPTE